MNHCSFNYSSRSHICVIRWQKLEGEVWNKLAVEDKEGWQKHSKERVME